VTEQLIVNIASAVNIWTLYPSNHPRVVKAAGQVIESLDNVLRPARTDSVTFLVVGDDLVVEQEVVRKSTLSHVQFISNLKERGVERLTLARGIDEAEASALIGALATGTNLESSPHVTYGRVEVETTEEKDKTKKERRELTSEQLDVVREAFAQFRTHQTLPVGAIEQLVWGFVEALSRSTRSVLPLAKLKQHDEYTFVHSVNVSLLVMSQARSFGIQGPMLHSFGTAALLHDIGKLLVPLSVLNHPGKLEGDEWAIMQSHAEQGAAYLSSVGQSSELAVLVAYEHHLRYDMKPAYPILSKPRRPNLIARMTAIADAYDAMSTVRPYQKPLMRAAALEILAKRADTFYDPLLIGNFTRMVREMGKEIA
jgi:putative nucleotidyltransferase with HDIG domain